MQDTREEKGEETRGDKEVQGERDCSSDGHYASPIRKDNSMKFRTFSCLSVRLSAYLLSSLP